MGMKEKWRFGAFSGGGTLDFPLFADLYCKIMMAKIQPTGGKAF
jgi:hypothetical protein